MDNRTFFMHLSSVTLRLAYQALALDKFDLFVAGLLLADDPIANSVRLAELRETAEAMADITSVLASRGVDELPM